MTGRRVILVVDDEAGMRESLCEILARDGYANLTAGDGWQAIQLVQEKPVDLVLLDIKMPGLDGIETLKRIKALHEQLPVVMVTGYGTIESAVQAMKYGAKDYITKPFVISNLRNVITENLKPPAAAATSSSSGPYEGIIGQSPAMKRLFQTLAKVIASEATVLIMGESGTGKELVARAIHREGPRKERPFIGINCAAIPENLLESELFGYEKGAFTGAVARRIGKFEQADGGTLFLDEIGDMNLATQAKILRVLEERELVRLGAVNSVKINVRIIAATNKDLLEAVNAGSFREDLYYRLNVVPLLMPALRERKEDVPLLVKHFLLKYSEEYSKPMKSIPPQWLEMLKNYHWPGNVRELRNIVERIVVLGEKGFNLEEQLNLEENPPPAVETAQMSLKLTDKQEQEKIQAALEMARWNKTRAAEILEISRKSLYEKMAKYGLL
ncbi:two-component system response regulator AtoC/two-component system nitrogen regulation response regulator NtrX [Hydrogenispora ethanolica]|uniref:Two-component system response regulator AtoC/two-component system nitrogen regulation response regulator NtrX n=1 Tax=Hydrogenispora ethanolica TaxID=1082276 RepID=A0A4R1QU46_HYDET|nr:sigma-54 dependent transcriptional regulator [Hydrogenispora ethanolica]TCL56035.1 two-component system response regulator AtoC/two-component system nitrogen regulation response regulator NtrX [Hydrogenispora ethanolica]